MIQKSFLCPKRTLCSLLLLALLAAGLALPLVPAPAQATDIRYARPLLHISIREQAAPKSKIVANINLSEPLEVLKEVGDWVQVKSQSGTTGWVAAKYLGTAPVVPEDYFQPGSGSGQVLIDSGNVFKELSTANDKLKQDLASCTTDLGTIQDKYDTMTQDPDSIIHTKTTLEETRARLREQEEQLAQLQIDYKALKMNQSIMWFLAGAGALFLGWLIGRFSSGRKQRSSLY